jgi:hypothetical protein
MFTQTCRTILQLLVVVILMSAGVTKVAHANVIGLDAPDPRTLKYVCCNVVDLTKNAVDDLEITYPVDIGSVGLLMKPDGCTAGAPMGTIVTISCTTKLSEGDKIIASITPTNNGLVTAMWTVKGKDVGEAIAAPEPASWLLLMVGFIGLVLGRKWIRFSLRGPDSAGLPLRLGA